MTLIDSDSQNRRRERQLTFDVGMGAGAAPDLASLKVGGDMPVWRDLKNGEQVHILITDMDGQALTSWDASVSGIAFVTKRDKFGDVESIERKHTLTLG